MIKDTIAIRKTQRVGRKVRLGNLERIARKIL
jgi:hypothetical protein